MFSVKKMAKVVDKLRNVSNFSEEETVHNLKTILAQGTDLEIHNNDVVKNLLKVNKNEIIKLSTEVVAEWAKIDTNRKIMTNEEIIKDLLSLLDNPEVDIVFNTIRALGNICYENEEACQIVEKVGINSILSLLRNDCEREDTSLTTKVAGLLVNLFTYDELPKAALKNNIIPILENLLLKYNASFEDNQMLLTFLISIMNHLSDYLDEQNIPFTDNLCQIIINIFKASTSPEISVMCLEIFHGQLEKDEIKTILAREGVCELLFDLIEKYRHQVNDEESRSVLKMACDVIVVILTGDDCMNILYGNGKGKVYLNMITWLDSEDPDLLSTGVLAVGNFARKDVHCLQMVKNGISKKLIGLLLKYNTSSSISDVKIQHALLSTLKNLVIPQPNKGQVLQEGLIDALYPMLKIDHPLVVFKLLGTFRIVIDGQESAALDLISRRDFLEKLAYWCYNSDHLGVRGEVPRLLAWLIKNCHSFKPFDNVLSVQETIKCIVEMISSNHAVMQNEAFYVLDLLCVGCSNDNIDKLTEGLMNADIGKNLHFVIGKYGEKMDKPTIENLITLLEQLIKHKTVIDHLNLSNIKGVLEKVSGNSNAHEVSQKIQQILNALDT